MMPTHVAIIMDGNGRWAQSRGLERQDGHKAGAHRVRAITEACIDHGIEVLTVYAFSTENWDRPAGEVGFLLDLIPERLQAERSPIFEHQVRVRVLGDIAPLPFADRIAIENIVRQTRNHDTLDLNIAFNYGGRAEIVRALRQLIEDGIAADDITEELVSTALYTAGQPDPDLLIRTGGECRSSNFLVWQSIYSEFYFTETLWPDFTRDEFEEALQDFGKRQRTFGRVSGMTSNADAVSEL